MTNKYSKILSDIAKVERKYKMYLFQIEEMVKSDILFNDKIKEDSIYIQNFDSDGLIIMIEHNNNVYGMHNISANGIAFSDFLKLKEKFKKVPIDEILKITYI